MIDIHMHILPNIDDGSPSLDDSLEMADIAARSGVDTIIMTPHCNIPDYYENFYSLSLMRAFSELKRALEHARIPVQVLPGMEIFTTPEVPALIQARKVIGLNFSNYVLVEFNFGSEADWMTQMLSDILKTGCRPVIAHPERYDVTYAHPQIAFEWVQMGCLLQCNKGSFLGSFGRQAEETSHVLLDHHLVSFIASDAHRPHIRTPHMQEIYQYIAYEYTEEMALKLMNDNPLRLCRNQNITADDILPFETRQYWKFE